MSGAAAAMAAPVRDANRDVQTAIGLGVWMVAVVVLPMSASLQARILLLAPLVIVPRLLPALRPEAWSAARMVPGPWAALLTALALVAAFASPPGPLAAAMALPWLAFAYGLAAAATLHGLRRLPQLLHPRRAAELAGVVAAGFLAVGGTFIVVDRLGIEPLGFSGTIVMLTAVHFHWAGFGLLAVGAWLAGRRPRLGPLALGLMAGIPVTAAGFVLGSSVLSALGALMTGASGIGIGLALLLGRSLHPGARRLGLALAGLALLIGMPVGIAWASALALGTTFLDIDAMVRTHGALNAVAVTLAALALPGRE
ncbi:MAG: hypothetical protein QOH61_813 [Chloroflexota bacterium]|jgi:hypothetical protein|nr:hypothetical protein [Chloroflexota bacterium]